MTAEIMGDLCVNMTAIQVTGPAYGPVAGSGKGFLRSFLSRHEFLRSATGFEGCSMVPSIYPLETLHNSLSLKQMDEFLTAVCESGGYSHTKANKGYVSKHISIPPTAIIT